MYREYGLYFFQVLYVETFFQKESFVIEIISVRTVVFI